MRYCLKRHTKQSLIASLIKEKKKTTQIEKLEDKKKAVIATFRQNNIKSSRC